MSPWQMRFLIINILLKRSPQYAKSCRKEVLQTTPKLSCGTVDLGLITSSQYHVMNCLIWFLDRLWSPDARSDTRVSPQKLFWSASSVYHKGCELFFAEVHVDSRHETSHCQTLSQETITWLPTIQESQTYIQPDVSLQVLREGNRQLSHFPSAKK